MHWELISNNFHLKRLNCTVSNKLCGFNLPVIESKNGIIIFDKNETKIIKRFKPIFLPNKRIWVRDWF